MTERNQSITLDSLVKFFMPSQDGSQDDSPISTILRILIQASLIVQRDRHLQCSSHQRSSRRVGYRNGFKKRTLRTPCGNIHINTPQVRGCDSPFHPFIPNFERGSRIDRSLALAIAEMYIQGVSTRKVAKIMKRLTGGISVSSAYVSRCTAQLDSSLEQWRNRPIPPISFLFLDATYLKVRSEGCVRDCAALMATGICEGSGKRMVLGVSVSPSEASLHWKSFILSLIARGMNRPLCVTSDDHCGIRSALAQTLTGVPWQRCQFRFQRNAASFISRKSLKPLVASLVRTIFNAPDMQTASQTLHSSLASLRGMQQHDLADWLEENIHECLTILNFPPEIRRHIRTSNCMENLNLVPLKTRGRERAQGRGKRKERREGRKGD